jgi:cation transport protein ChaC
MTTDDGDLWVFGYGSLMWRPGFAFLEQSQATLHGYHRSLCIYSHVHRGTPERPGLVLGLDRGGSCHGVAFRVAADRREETITYLRAREQATLVYRETWHRLRLIDGRIVISVAYTVDRSHIQYAGKLPQEDLMRLVLQGIGISGKNPDYVLATHQHLVSLGLKDRTLAALVKGLSASAV